MSLKAFHIAFITSAVLLALGFGVWSFVNYLSGSGTTLDLVYVVASGVLAVALVVYGRYFLKKLKHISYL